MKWSLRHAEFVASLSHLPVVTPAQFPIVTNGLVHQVESLAFDAQAHGSTVTAWNDKTTFNHNWTTATSGLAGPTVDKSDGFSLNGHATLRFDGATQGLGSPLWFSGMGGTGAEMFVVMKRIVGTGPTNSGPCACFNRMNSGSLFSNHHPWYADLNFYEAFGRADRPALGIPGSATGQANGSYRQQFAVYNVSSAADGSQWFAAMHTSSALRSFFFVTSGYVFSLSGNETVHPGFHTVGYDQDATASNLFFNGWIAAVYVYNRVLTPTERQNMLYYLDYTWNITVQGWRDRCRWNYGVSPTNNELSAARTLWLACMSSNLPAKIKALNLFSSAPFFGASATAIGGSATPLVNGFTFDPWTNTGFVNADVNPNGMKGDGASKFLNTAFFPTGLASPNSAGITLYASDAGHLGTERYDSGYTANSGDPSFVLCYADSGVSNQARFGCWAFDLEEARAPGKTFGYLSGNRVANNDSRIYWSTGTDAHQQIGSTDTNVTANLPQAQAVYFYAVLAYQSPAAYGFTAARYGAAAIHDGLTLAESQAFAAALMNYRLAVAPIVIPGGALLAIATPQSLTAAFYFQGLGVGSIQWYKDGVALANSSVYSGVTTPTLTITAADNTAAGGYTCQANIAGSSTVLSSNVCGVGTQSLAINNPSFESPVVGGGTFTYAPANNQWNMAGNAGISGLNSAFCGSAVQDGVQCAFLQTSSGGMNQTITGLTVGKRYTVGWYANQRTTTFGDNTFDFQLDGVTIASYFPPGYSTTWTRYFYSFIATATSHNIGFLATNYLAGQTGDHSSLIDLVTVWF